MTMVPRGVIGVRMDGVENVAFRGLDVYNLYESASSGSDLCGEYWNEDFSSFLGGGHPFESAPYLSGFTGNMAHGVMSDWSTFSLENTINIHHIYSKTGLVRAIGLYTKSEVIYFKNVDVQIVDEPEQEDEPEPEQQPDQEQSPENESEPEQQQQPEPKQEEP